MLTLDVTLKGVILIAKLAVSYYKRKPAPGEALMFTASRSSYNERPMLQLHTTLKHGVSWKDGAHPFLISCHDAQGTPSVATAKWL